MTNLESADATVEVGVVDGLRSRESLTLAPKESATGEFSVSEGQTVVVVASVDGYGPLVGGGCQGG